MDLRLRHLEQLDDRAVPLPHGTEVVTRVDRTHEARRVPQGSVGRVVKLEGDQLDIAVIGVGVVRYERHELTPRRIGQALFAQRRADRWAALRSCAVLETVVGSQAWNLADDQSDIDLRGVFALPLPWTTGLVAAPEDLVSADGSSTFWALRKTVRQALRADPNTLEMLFLPGARALDPLGEWLLAERAAFVSVEIYGTFGRYATSQLHRMQQGLQLAHHRTEVLEWLRVEPELSLDQVADRLSKALTGPDRLQYAKRQVKQLYRSLFDQGLLESNEYSALRRFANERAAELDLPRELRPKNAYNLVRLLATATTWLRDGEPTFAATGALRDDLLAIKHGKRSLGEVLEQAESMIPALEAAHRASRLPARADVARADALLRRAGEELARRWITRAPGVFGREAPTPPEVAWND